MCTIKDDLEATGAKCSGSGDVECKKCEYVVQTNADRIRNMTDEELNKLLIRAEYAGYNNRSIAPRLKDGGYMDMLEWLRSESEE